MNFLSLVLFRHTDRETKLIWENKYVCPCQLIIKKRLIDFNIIKEFEPYAELKVGQVFLSVSSISDQHQPRPAPFLPIVLFYHQVSVDLALISPSQLHPPGSTWKPLQPNVVLPHVNQAKPKINFILFCIQAIIIKYI